jgi:hypothetical protein
MKKPLLKLLHNNHTICACLPGQLVWRVKTRLLAYSVIPKIKARSLFRKKGAEAPFLVWFY